MTTHVPLDDDAGRAAEAAARRSGVRIAELIDAPSHHAAAALLQSVWRAKSADTVMSASMMTALAYAGNYVVGAYDGSRLIGAAVGFFGTGQLHSHVAGVDRGTPLRGVGIALKQHQRAWALARGIPRVCWTFDPLVGRNAYFNLHKLGARATAYLPDFYGELPDGINLDDPTDRLYVQWELDTPAAGAAAAGRLVNIDESRFAGPGFAGATVVVDRKQHLPVVAGGDADVNPDVNPDADTQGWFPSDGRPILVAVPEDVETLRASDRAAASRWRYAVRWAMTTALSAGYHIDGISRDGFYALAIPKVP